MTRLATAYINIKETDAQIAQKISIAIRDSLNKIYDDSLKSIVDMIKKLIYDSITSQPEYFSLISGDLRVELGLIDGDTRLINIIEILISNLEIKFSKFRIVGSNLSGGIRVMAIRSDYSDILSIDDSILITEKGDRLPWLQWLLLRGDDVIIADYSIRYGNFGRTGGGHMVPVGSWSVPSYAIGVENNNFITRAMSSIEQRMMSNIQQIIDRNI